MMEYPLTQKCKYFLRIKKRTTFDVKKILFVTLHYMKIIQKYTPIVFTEISIF